MMWADLNKYRNHTKMKSSATSALAFLLRAGRLQKVFNLHLFGGGGRCLGCHGLGVQRTLDIHLPVAVPLARHTRRVESGPLLWRRLERRSGHHLGRHQRSVPHGRLGHHLLLLPGTPASWIEILLLLRQFPAPQSLQLLSGRLRHQIILAPTRNDLSITTNYHNLENLARPNLGCNGDPVRRSQTGEEINFLAFEKFDPKLPNCFRLHFGSVLAGNIGGCGSCSGEHP